MRTGNDPSFSLREVTAAEVLKLIKQAGNSKSYGVDDIDMMAIQHAQEELAPLIAEIINKTIRTDEYPARWKLARVLPL